MEECKLVYKVKRLIKQLGLPRWLHKYGPKTYETWHHLLALTVKSLCNLSYRFVVSFLRSLGFKCPAKSSLQDFAQKKLSQQLLRKILLILVKNKVYIAAVDSTCLQRTNPSYYYITKVGKIKRRIPVKFSALVDTEGRKFIDAVIRVLPAHDSKDGYSMIKRARISIKKIVGDKAYDSNKIHEECYAKGIEAHIPIRNYGKRVRHNKSSKRRLAQKHFNKRIYHRRSIIESMFHAFKKRFGDYVRSKKARMIRIEIYLKMIAYNLFFWFIWRFRTHPLLTFRIFLEIIDLKKINIRNFK